MGMAAQAYRCAVHAMSASSCDGPAGETLDERVARRRQEHACLRNFDELMFCLTPSNQFNKYYFEGTYDNCPTRFKSWQTCLQTKISKHEDAEALRQREWRESVPGTHIWAFRPEYATEAYGRCGVRPAAPAEPLPAPAEASVDSSSSPSRS